MILLNHVPKQNTECRDPTVGISGHSEAQTVCKIALILEKELRWMVRNPNYEEESYSVVVLRKLHYIKDH